MVHAVDLLALLFALYWGIGGIVCGWPFWDDLGGLWLAIPASLIGLITGGSLGMLQVYVAGEYLNDFADCSLQAFRLQHTTSGIVWLLAWLIVCGLTVAMFLLTFRLLFHWEIA